MSNLTAILTDLKARSGLAPWDPIPERVWPEIASRCGEAEVVELTGRIEALRRDLDEVEDWDGDSRDEIHRVIEFFSALSKMIDPSR